MDRLFTRELRLKIVHVESADYADLSHGNSHCLVPNRRIGWAGHGRRPASMMPWMSSILPLYPLIEDLSAGCTRQNANTETNR